MKHNQNGFSPIIIILGLLVVSVVGFGGWTAYQNDKESDLSQKPTSKNEIVTQDKEPVRKAMATAPAGWTQYAHAESGISFYHPAQWVRNDIKISTYGVDMAISSGFGTPDSVVYDTSAKTWGMYLNYGDPVQKKIDPDESDLYGLKATTLSESEFPAAYKQAGHASMVTHDIFLIANDDMAVRIRLPMINSSDDQAWEKKLAEQAQALPDIIKSIAIR